MLMLLWVAIVLTMIGVLAVARQRSEFTLRIASLVMLAAAAICIVNIGISVYMISGSGREPSERVTAALSLTISAAFGVAVIAIWRAFRIK